MYLDYHKLYQLNALLILFCTLYVLYTFSHAYFSLKGFLHFGVWDPLG